MKPKIPQGTRDFNSETVQKRKYILETIQSIFELFAYQPIETPAMEQMDTLLGKYGEEGDRLIFKILNNGLNNKQKHAKATTAFNNVLNGINDKNLTERALRYDLTIPFARYVVLNQQNLTFPFKRYQMQPVWRADRPQRGRYREFWQCDADVIGSPSLINEAELLSIYKKAFAQLRIPEVTISINNRKILAGLANHIEATALFTDLTVAIDKLDKIGIDKVVEELIKKGFTQKQCAVIKSFLDISGTNQEKLDQIEQMLINDDTALKGINELRQILNYYTLSNGNLDGIVIDFTLARGLNYYTGMIVEVSTTAVKIGSIGGGGRYDDLTGLFGLKNMSGVGISFGIDRIYDVIEELSLFPETLNTTVDTIFLSMTPEGIPIILKAMEHFRSAGLSCEMLADMGKFDKQMKFANKRGTPFVIIIGENEIEHQQMTIKNMNTGEQRLVDNIEGAINIIQENKG